MTTVWCSATDSLKSLRIFSITTMLMSAISVVVFVVIVILQKYYIQSAFTLDTEEKLLIPYPLCHEFVIDFIDPLLVSQQLLLNKSLR